SSWYFPFSCLVVLIGNLAWTALAEGDFDSEKARVIEIYGNPNVDKATKDRNADFLAIFLDKFSNRIQLTPDLRKRVADEVTKYKEEKAKQALVDGAPPQGGFPQIFDLGPLVNIGVEVAEGYLRVKEL
ncbi:hypothetical protein KR032_004590, partial [Drosophila birchii]